MSIGPKTWSEEASLGREISRVVDSSGKDIQYTRGGDPVCAVTKMMYLPYAPCQPSLITDKHHAHSLMALQQKQTPTR